jgi:hypothetical protein
MLSRALDEPIDTGEIELTFLRLDQSPVDRSQHCVAMDRYNFWPHCLHVRQVGGRGVLKLTSANEEWLSVDDDLGGCSLRPDGSAERESQSSQHRKRPTNASSAHASLL